MKWELIKRKALENLELRQEDLLSVLESSDGEILELVAAARKVRERYFGQQVKLQYLINVKSGLCPEDCKYCSQSKISKAPIQKYPILSTREIEVLAKRGLEAGASKVCLVASGDRPSEKEIAQLSKAVQTLKTQYPEIELCASLGLVNKNGADDLKQSGLETYNHNINTSEAYYPEICSSHSYQDRIETIQAVQDAGMHICSGVIAGLGETNEDLVQMATDLRKLKADFIPVNFLVPVEKTPFEGKQELTPVKCLKILAMMRFANPTREIRIAGGREYHLGSLQPLGLYIANAIFIGDYLTTKGQTAALDLAMIQDMGYSVQDRPGNFVNDFFVAHPELRGNVGGVIASLAARIL